MGWLTKTIGFFTSDVGSKVIEAADELHYSSEEKGIQDSKDVAIAKQPNAPSHNTWFDALIDGYNRLPRPAFATWGFGELVGWWNVDISKISAEKMSLIIIIVTFYFAGRALLKDLPGVIKTLRRIK